MNDNKYSRYYRKHKKEISDRRKQRLKCKKEGTNYIPSPKNRNARNIRKAKIRTMVNNHKVAIGCNRCGTNELDVLEFHHIDRESKQYNISELMNGRFSIDDVIKEISKCIVLCKNCHMSIESEFLVELSKSNSRTYRQQRCYENHRRFEDKRQSIIDKAKQDSGCCFCGEHNLDVLTFHHLDERNKKHNLSAHIPNNELVTEIEKCIVLCGNCHVREEKNKSRLCIGKRRSDCKFTLWTTLENLAFKPSRLI